MSRHHRAHAQQLRASRAHWRSLLPLPCPRCGRLVFATDAWDAGHVIPAEAGGDGSIGNTRPEHRACNRGAGGKRGAHLTNAKRQAQRQLAQPAPIITETKGLLEW